MGEEQTVCGSCGSRPPDGAEGAARLAWVRGVERGRPVWTCSDCSRRYLRSIEWKLDAQGW